MPVPFSPRSLRRWPSPVFPEQRKSPSIHIYRNKPRLCPPSCSLPLSSPPSPRRISVVQAPADTEQFASPPSSPSLDSSYLHPHSHLDDQSYQSYPHLYPHSPYTHTPPTIPRTLPRTRPLPRTPHPDTYIPSLYDEPSPRPPDDICAKINTKIRGTIALSRPDFDFAAHASRRRYTICTYDMHPDLPGPSPSLSSTYSGATGAALLDASVARCLPSPDFSPVPPQIQWEKDTYVVARAEHDKGLGLFAARDLHPGGSILVERPVLVLPYVLAPLPGGQAVADLYAEVAGRLGGLERRGLASLAGAEGLEEGEKEGKWIERVVRTNALGIELEVGKDPDGESPELSTHRAVFLAMSRCNHSPNATWIWDTSSFSLRLTALRPILRGEEITIAYAPATVTSPLRERQAALLSLYGFTCRCSICLSRCSPDTSPTPTPHLEPSKTPLSTSASTSDVSRAYLATFWDSSHLPTFEAWCADPSLPDSMLIDAHLRALELIRKEGLEVLEWERHVDTVAMCWGALGNVVMFRTWLNAARAAHSNRNKDADAHWRRRQGVMEGWWRDPRTFAAWGWRSYSSGA